MNDPVGNNRSINCLEKRLSIAPPLVLARSSQSRFCWIPLVSRHRAIPSDAPHTNHTLETRHLAGSTPDVGSAGHCESVAVAPRTCGFLEPWRRLDEGFTCAAGQFFQRPAGIANQQRHAGARANNSQRASVHAREPTRSLCGAGVATARLAVHFA